MPLALFTVAPELPFADTVARAWLDACGRDPVRAGDGLILLPTRRSARTMADAFMRAAPGPALLLPRLAAIGDAEEATRAPVATGLAPLPPPVAPVERLALLSRLVLARGGHDGAPRTLDRAWPLAAELARLLDEAAREGVPLGERLRGLEVGALASHWEITLDFLRIVTEAWPAILTERGVLDGAARQARLLEALASHWGAVPPAVPVWIAGVNALAAPEATLARTVAAMPGGRVLLPGLDQAIDDADWEAIEAVHPQAGLKGLLGRIAARRDEVRPLGDPADPSRRGRTAFLRRALLPAEAVARRWRETAAASDGGARDPAIAAQVGDPAIAAGARDLPVEPQRDLPVDRQRDLWSDGQRRDLPLDDAACDLSVDGVSLLVAADEQEEAVAIALVLRDAIEDGRTEASLVTPDRALARRVSAELGRFGILADDSAGEALGDTPPAVFLRLIAAVLAEGWAPATLLALLRHPLAAFGTDRASCRRAARALELAALRGPRLAPGPDAIRRALDARAERHAAARAEREAVSEAERQDAARAERQDPARAERQDPAAAERGEAVPAACNAVSPDAPGTADGVAADGVAAHDSASAGAPPARGTGRGAEARALLGRVEAALSPLAALFAAERVPPAILLDGLIEAAERAADTGAGDRSGSGPGTQGGAEALWSGVEGDALASLLAGLRDAIDGFDPEPPVGLPGLLDAAIAGIAVHGTPALRGRAAATLHDRVTIRGLLEARGQTVEVLVLGGLVETVWPGTADPGPWMGRQMRAAIGLPSPEERLGGEAHDFATLVASAGRVVLARSERRDRAPAVPSRWLARMEASLHGTGLALPHHPAVEWSRSLDRPAGPPRPVAPPAPRPPVAARPRHLSVTAIGTWQRDPYAIHARHVLGLRELPALEEDADHALFGTVVHAGLADARRAGRRDAAGLAAALCAALDAEAVRPGLAAWWRPRLVRIADFVAAEDAARPEPAAIALEIDGAVVLDGPAGAFRLTGRADRLERDAAGGITVLDYKTGAPPSKQDVLDGWAAQLPLEAAMARRGGFGDAFAGGAVAALVHWKLSGGAEPGRVFAVKPADAAAAAEAAWAGLRDLIAAYDDPATPYLAQPHPGRAPRFSAYAALARVGEWRLDAGADDAEGEA